MTTAAIRRLPVGAEPLAPGGVHFRVWAPRHDSVELVADAGDPVPLNAEPGGYFSALVEHARAGTRYRYRLGGREPVPDPASRSQPDGPHGDSAVVDAGAFPWSDAGWRGPADARQVIYELHVGTFTAEGSWLSAAERLPMLAELGITLLELMPVAEFPGRFNWGYDGVALFAPAHVYGTPDDMRHFVNRAHELGMGVILDVVYNHLGPDGCYLPEFADSYVSRRYKTDWGDALNFDGPGSEPVREFVLSNVEYWIHEFHLDGLRVDATQNVYDAGTPHILTEMTARARAAAGGRRVWLVAENEPQDTRIFTEHGFDAAWNDDFHHSARVALTGRAEAYYTDYGGTPQELISAARWGYLYQGQHYSWQQQRRGTGPLGLAARRLVHYLQNHDQVANSATGARIHEQTSPGELRALTALLHLMPQHAMLFHGQEFNASSPFLFFADHAPALARTVHRGRRQFLAQFPSAALPELQESIADPATPATFEQCKLRDDERIANDHVVALHRDLIRLARTDGVFAAQDPSAVHGAVLAADAFALRWLCGSAEDRLLLINLGDDLALDRLPEPLLSLPQTLDWAVLWTSEDPAYGGSGAPPPQRTGGAWSLTGRCAFVLVPVPVPSATERSDG